MATMHERSNATGRDHADMHAKGKAMMEAFKSDHFVMNEVEPEGDVHAKASEMSTRFLGVVEQVLPMLTPEQRALAAAKIREHARGGADAHQEEMMPIGE